MNENNKKITLYRTTSNRSWFSDPTAILVFTHLLLSANTQPELFLDDRIERGQFATDYNELSKRTGLSVKEIRSACAKLSATRDILIKKRKYYIIVEVLNYDILMDREFFVP